MKRLTALLLAGALALALCACGGDAPAVEPSASPEPTASPSAPPEDRPFTLAYDPSATLHPIRGESQVNGMLTALVWQGLYELDNTFTPQPVLARSAAADEGGRVWTVTIRAGVTFSDGTPLTARHAADSLNAARSSARYAARLSTVASVTAQGDDVIISLYTPNGDLPALLDIPVVLEQGGGTPLGTGRYCFEEGPDGLRLTANPLWTGTLPFAAIALHPVSGADSRLDAFNSGAVTMVAADPNSLFSLGYGGDCERWDYPTTELICLGFNTVRGPCRYGAVRRAVSLLCDRTGLVRSALSGLGDPAALPVSPLCDDYDSAAAQTLVIDPDGAAALLEGAGFASGEDGVRHRRSESLSVTILVNADSAAKTALAEGLAEELRAAGFEVTVDGRTWRDYQAALAAGSFDLYVAEVRLTGDFNFTPLLSGTLNYGQYSLSGLSDVLSAWTAARGAARTAAAEALWTRFAQEVPLAPICFKRRVLLVRPGAVTGLSPTRADLFAGMESWGTAGR